jgi:RNA polymerase primary sigma factor
MQTYTALISAYPPTTADEERELGRRARAGDAEAQNRLVEAHLFYAFRIVKRCWRANRHADLDDLVQAASMGLLEAARQYDGRDGVRFRTFGKYWLRTHLARALRDAAGGSIRIPERASKENRLFSKAQRYLSRRGEPTTNEQIAQFAEVPVERVRAALTPVLAMTARYVERDTNPLRAAADQVAGRISAAMNPKGPP